MTTTAQRNAPASNGSKKAAPAPPRSKEKRTSLSSSMGDNSSLDDSTLLRILGARYQAQVQEEAEEGGGNGTHRRSSMEIIKEACKKGEQGGECHSCEQHSAAVVEQAGLRAAPPEAAPANVVSTRRTKKLNPSPSKESYSSCMKDLSEVSNASSTLDGDTLQKIVHTRRYMPDCTEQHHHHATTTTTTTTTVPK